MTNVRMPNGDVVSFPDDMPKEQIKSLIASKFPEVAQQQAPAEKPYGVTDAAADFNSAYEMTPLGLPARLGRMALESGPDIIKSGVQAVTAPMRAMTGELPMTDAAGRTSPQAIEEAFNMATWATPNSPAMLAKDAIPKAASSIRPPSEGAQVAQAAQDLGVTLPRAVTSDNAAVNQLGKTVANIPVVGQPLRKASRTAIEQMDTAAKRVQDELGTGSKDVAGNRIRQDMATFAKVDEPAKVTELYSKVDSLVDPAARIPLSETQRIAQNINARRSASRLEGSSAVDFVGKALQAKEGMSYEEIKGLRTAIGELKKNKSELAARKIADSELDAIYNGLSTDLKNAVRQSDKGYIAARQKALAPAKAAEEALKTRVDPTRTLPQDNFYRDLGREAKYLFRETSNDELGSLLWGQLSTLGGQKPMFWADVPHLARGQFDNTGVVLISNAEGIHGALNLAKPMSRFTYGDGAEYVSRDGVSMDKIVGILVKKGHDIEGYQKNLLEKNFLPRQTEDGVLWSRKPGEFVPPTENLALAAFNEANSRAKTFARDKEALNKVIGGGSDENITSRLIALAGNTSRANIKDLALAKSKVSKETWDELASSALQDMGRDASGNLTPDRFVTSWGKMSESGKKLLFSPEHRKALDDLATVSSRFKKLNEYANPSGTGQTLMTGALGGAAFVDPITAIKVAIPGYVTARFLASPASAKAVADYAKAYELAAKAPGTTSQNALASKSRALALIAANGNEQLASNLAARMATIQQTAAEEEGHIQVRKPVGENKAWKADPVLNQAVIEGRAI